MATTQQWTRAQVAAAGAGRCLVLIDGVVYDVTRYLATHPGGAEVLQQVAGTDASQEFHDLGHSADALALLPQYAVGELAEREGAARGERAGSAWARALGVLVVVLAALYMFLPR